MQIDKTGIYLTRDGREAEIDYLDDSLARVCGNIDKHFLSWKIDGRYRGDRERGCDIIKYLRPLPLTNQQVMLNLAQSILTATHEEISCNPRYTDIILTYPEGCLAHQLAKAVIKEYSNDAHDI